MGLRPYMVLNFSFLFNVRLKLTLEFPVNYNLLLVDMLKIFHNIFGICTMKFVNTTKY